MIQLFVCLYKATYPNISLRKIKNLISKIVKLSERVYLCVFIHIRFNFSRLAVILQFVSTLHFAADCLFDSR